MRFNGYSFYYKFYLLLQKNFLTNAILIRVRQRYEILCPAQETYIVQKTVKTLLFTWVVILLEIIGIIRLRPSILQAMIAIMCSVILHNEIIQFCVQTLEQKILIQLEQFITDIRHHYYVSRMVDDAIFDALDHTPYEMRVHALKFHDIITSENCEELADRYHLSSHNNFLNLFLALCVTVVEYGDRKINDQSLFLMNLSNLKVEINLEVLKLKQQNYLYSGLSFVIIAPMTVMKVIEHWGISNLAELSTFYQGKFGYVTAFLIISISIIIYRIVSEFRGNQSNDVKDYILINALLEQRKLAEALNNYILYCRKAVNRLKKILDESGEVIQLRQVLMMKFFYAFLAYAISTGVSIFYLIRENGRYDWYELLAATFIALVSFKLPDLKLQFHRKIAVMGREDEMIRYQSILLMLMYIERISVIEVLERIEEFSYLFRKQIQNCINNYNASDALALEELKESTSFLPFQRMVDNFMMSDEIGIELAFDEVAADRQHFQEKRKQENEMNLKQRFELAQFIAYIPAILVIGGYLILPFLLECYNQLNQYQEMMNTFLP